MHDARVIVGRVERINVAGMLLEVSLRTCLNVVPKDLDVVISVWSRLFVPEAKRMRDLVDDDTDVPTPPGQFDWLWTDEASNIPNI